MKSFWRRIVSVILVLAMVFMALPEYVAPVKTARADSTETATHYIAVGSDRHKNTNGIPSAMGSMPSSVEYVCLAGDMDKFDPYNTSTIQNEVWNAGLTKATVQVLYARPHDDAVVDDAGILQCRNESGLMYTGYNEDGTVAYYVYGIAFISVSNAYGTPSDADAIAFKEWVDNNCQDTSIPIIVISHVPFHWQRTDNPGAIAWNKVLNYAATGKETTSAGEEIIRNVVFLHGHNHTTEDDKEYYIPAESNMKIYNKDNTSHIYYTYTTAGYLGGYNGTYNQAATLIGIDDENITISKYKDGAVASTYASTGAKTDFSDTYDTDAVHVIERVYAGKMVAKNAAVMLDENGNVASKQIDYTCIVKGTVVVPELTFKTLDNDIIESISDTGEITFTGNAGTAKVTIDWSYGDESDPEKILTGSNEITVYVREYGQHTWGIPQWDWSEDLTSAKATFYCVDEGCGDSREYETRDITSYTTTPNCVIPLRTEYKATVIGPDEETAYTGIKHVGSPKDIEAYVMVDKITLDTQNPREYLIVDSNSAGNNAHVLKNNNGSVASGIVTIHEPDEEIKSSFILADGVSADSVWKANALPSNNSYPCLFNNGYYAYITSSDSEVISLYNTTNSLNRYWTYEGSGKLAARSTSGSSWGSWGSWGTSSSTYYVVYDNGFKASTSGSGIYIYEKQTIAHSEYGNHNYEYKGITWNEGYSSAYATYECAYCHTTATVTITDGNITKGHRDADCIHPDRTAYTATISAQDSLDGMEHIDDDFAFVPTQIGTSTTVNDATVYVLADTVKDGKNYLIVVTDSTGSHAVSNKPSNSGDGNKSVADTSVIVTNGKVNDSESEVAYILTDDKNTDFGYAVWKATQSSNGTTFKNGEFYLYHESGKVYVRRNISSSNSKANLWSVGSNTLKYTSSYNSNNTYFLTYDDGWTMKNKSANVLFYEELTGATIVKTVYRDAQPLGHDLTTVEEKEATCTEEGTVACWYCKRCEKYFADDEGKTVLTDKERSKPIDLNNHDWSYKYTWADDYKTVTAERTCALCQAKETDTAKAIGKVTIHATGTKDGERTWTSGEFPNNDAFEPQTTTETIPAGTISFVHSCSLKNNLMINYYVPADSLVDSTDIRLVVQKKVFVTDDNGITKESWETQELTKFREDDYKGTHYRIYSFSGIAAREMGSELRATVYAKENGQEWHSQTDEYSVKDYAYNKLKTSEDTELKQLLVEMLNYGAAAQEIFEYNTNNLVNSDLTVEQQELYSIKDPVINDNYEKTIVDGSTAHFYTQSLVLKSSVEIKYYMKFDTTPADTVQLRLTYTTATNDKEMVVIEKKDFEYDADRGCWTAKVNSIAAKDMCSVVTAEIFDGDTMIGDVFKYSIESYVARKLNNANTDEKLKEVCLAMIKYGKLAAGYLGN